jgi:hypothetical protein
MPNFFFIRTALRHSYLYSKPFDILKRFIGHLKNVGGFQSTDIVNDLWVLKNNQALAEERIRILNKYNVPAKTWMLRCSEATIAHTIKLYQDKLDLYDGFTPDSYLKQRLGISDQEIARMHFRYFMLSSVKPDKMFAMTSMLIEEQVGISEIVNKSRIYGFSIGTVRERIQQLRHAGCKEIDLSVVKLRQDKFDQVLKQIDIDNSRLSSCII